MANKKQDIALIEQRPLKYKLEWEKGFLKTKVCDTRYSSDDVFGFVAKVYNDGSHFVATRKILGLSSSSKKSEITDKDRFFDEQYFNAVKNGYTHNKLRKHLKTAVLEQYPFSNDIDSYIDKKIKGKLSNYYSRVKRLKRKANLNLWNRFVTITYDDKKHTEESFRNKLKKCLSNFHSRRGWNYMGVFEKAPDTNRLHFHALMYIPKDQMVGFLEERRDYSTRLHKMQTTTSSNFFQKKFGRNDFEELTSFELKNGNAVNYLTKYLFKSNEKITYSRGIPSELEIYINNNDVASIYEDFVLKYVLFDDCFDSFNNYTPYKSFKPYQTNMFDYERCS